MRAGDEFNPHRRFYGAWTPLWLLRRKEVSAGAKMLYGQLCKYAGDNGIAWPKGKALADALGTNERQIRRWLMELEDWALVRTFNPERKGNEYRFLWHKWIEEVDAESDGDEAETEPEEEQKRPDKLSSHDRTNCPPASARPDKLSSRDRTNCPPLLHEEIQGKENHVAAAERSGSPKSSSRKVQPRKKDAPPPNPLHRPTYERYLQRLGCVDTKAPGNNAALKWLLDHDFSPDEIDRCHAYLLGDPWFSDLCKPVTLIDIKNRIGTWRQNGSPEKFNGRKPQQRQAHDTPSDRLARLIRERPAGV